VYLFGSAVHSEQPDDVDLAVVYDKPLTPLSAPSIKPVIQGAVFRSFGLAAHLMFFTTSEANEPGLLASLDARCIYERDVTGCE
jgi:hypothetical protein